MAATATKTEWLTPPEVAKELGIEPEKVRAWIEARKLDAVNVAMETGRTKQPRWRISREALEAFLASRSAEPVARPRQKRKLGKVTEYI